MNHIEKLLEENNLSHFKYFDNEPRLIYTYESGTSMHLEDFHRLIHLLKENNIKHQDIGVDVILLKK